MRQTGPACESNTHASLLFEDAVQTFEHAMPMHTAIRNSMRLRMLEGLPEGEIGTSESVATVDLEDGICG